MFLARSGSAIRLCSGPGVPPYLGFQVRRVVVGAVDQRRVVDLVAELRQDREDLVGPLPAQLDVLVLAELHDLRAVALLDLRLPGEHLLQRGLALLLHLLAEGAADDVPLAPYVLPCDVELPTAGVSAWAPVARTDPAAAVAASVTSTAADLNARLLVVT